MFQNVKNVRPPLSSFNLSYRNCFTADMGYLYPVMVDEMLPGDVWDISNQAVMRCMPMVAPIVHEVNMFVHYFFVPNRLTWPKVMSGSPPEMTDGWELFITTGEDGTAAPTIPTWTPTDVTVGSVWDYFGMPVGITPDANHRPIALPLRAYNMIWNAYYRDEQIQDRREEYDDSSLCVRNWEKDYFTSALEDQQLGVAPALPISGIINTSAEWPAWVSATQNTMYTNAGANVPYDANTKTVLDNNTVAVDLSGATTFDISDLRLAFAMQRFLELNNRSGVRYTEQLNGHFGIRPQDSRMQRPEYVGGTRAPLIVSEVLQTSSSDATSDQGNMAGHGICINNQRVGRFRAFEHGWIIGLMSIMPRPLYQNGINRQFLRRTVYDYYWPEMANLSEQAVERCEIYTSAVEAENETVFGYQGAYDEYRVKHSRVCGLMRTDFDTWTLSRQFSSPPSLNSAFLACNPRKDFLAAPSEPAFVVNFGNIVRALRPMPIQAEPGMLDHIYGG